MTVELDPVRIAIAWRPQGFGRRGLRPIRDPLVEPLWTGPRVLAALTPGRAELVHDGRLLELPATLRAQLASALLADAIVAEGVVTPEALATGEGAWPEPEEVRFRPRRLLFGSLGERRERLVRERGDAVRAQAAGDQLPPTLFAQPTAFVATDLLWLDGEPLLDVPLLERKRLLEAVLAESELVRRTAYVRPSAGGSLLAWRSLGFMQLAYKGANSRYRPGEDSDAWAIAPAPTTTPRPGASPGSGV
ncbi:MAG TPA: hypothetical protein VFK54_11045 [Candidatus Limnocylindrales bacterium]|nr:hypothetical protein [Candidatus Limnocylindrales bacterium]